MARRSFSGRLAPKSALIETPVLGSGTRLETAPGKATLLIAEKTTPRRFLTYDTGKSESLFVQLDSDFDPSLPSFVADQFDAIGFQIASMRIVYLSRHAAGELRLRRRERKPFFGPSRDVFEVALNLRFDKPTLDLAGIGEVEIAWRFTAEAPGLRTF